MTENRVRPDVWREFTDWHDNNIWIDPRRTFLDAVFLVEPKTKNQLINILATGGKEIDADADTTSHRESMLLTPLGQRALAEKEQGTSDEREKALDKWAKRWHLTAPWCFELAQRMIIEPTDQSSLQEKFTFECPGWDPLREGQKTTGKRPPEEERVTAKERITAAFEDALRRHFEEKEEQVARYKRLDPTAKKNAAHFLWAALFQAKNDSHDIIAETVGVRRSSVISAVKNVLELIELPQRPDKPRGRHSGGQKRNT